MLVVIDAQLLNWYYQEVIAGKETECTHSLAELFTRLGVEDTAVLDAGEQIETEWRTHTDPEWFDQWFPTLLSPRARSI